MRVLVAFGSTRGGTEELAEMVAEGLREEGLDVDVLPAAHTGHRLDTYDAVVVGGALYANRWHKDARRFVKRHAGELRRRPTFFFSSGPLDDSANAGEIPPVKGIRTLIELVGARGHVTFGGRLAPDARGVGARRIARTHAGDWRDRRQVRRWAASVAAQLPRAPVSG